MKEFTEAAKNALCVAINELYGHSREDVLRLFTVRELQLIERRADSQRPKTVEEVYRFAFDVMFERSEIGGRGRSRRRG